LKLKQAAMLCGTILQMQATTVALWFMTNWGIGKVVMSAILLTAISRSAWHIGRCMALESINRHPRCRKRQQVRRLPEQRRRFQVFDLEGELIEIPIQGTDLVEIRNVVGAKKNILPPTKAMQDVG
jgi:hypothetical protein